MRLVVDSVVGTEENLRNPLGTELSNVVDYYAERFDLNPVENAEVFLRTKQLFFQFAKLLKQDNSGILLIEDVAKLLKDPKYSKERGIDIPLPPFLVREFVVAGAELGGKLYKKLYPLTSQTTPPKSF